MTKKHTYPECEKLASARPEMMKLDTFLEWLAGQGIRLCTFDPKAYCGMGEYDQIRDNNETLLHRFFEIDQKKLETERCLILDRAREANEKER